MALTQASQQRIESFIDWFIRSDFVEGWTADKDQDFINEPDRATRCYDAAEHAADGKTHAEVIEDWREAFKAWVRDKRLWNQPERFMTAVEEHFDAIEAWHESHGSLYQQIG